MKPTIGVALGGGAARGWAHIGVLEALRASCALPGLSSPVRYGDAWLLDGGLVDPVPAAVRG